MRDACNKIIDKLILLNKISKVSLMVVKTNVLGV